MLIRKIFSSFPQIVKHWTMGSSSSEEKAPEREDRRESSEVCWDTCFIITV